MRGCYSARTGERMTVLPSWIDLVGLVLRRLGIAAGVVVFFGALLLLFTLGALELNALFVDRGWKE